MASARTPARRSRAVAPQEVEPDDQSADGFTCCTLCGKVLDDAIFSNDVTFAKGAGGATQARVYEMVAPP